MNLAYNLAGLNVPHLDQYFGVWGVEELRFRAMVSRFDGYDLAEHVARARQPAGGRAVPARADGYQVADGVAIIDLAGTLLKYDSSLIDGTSTVRARQLVRNAADDPAVKAILLRIDSPGGIVAGTHELGADVAAAAARKPTWAFVDDMAASCAYWIASQASKVHSNEMGLVGAIGTFTVLVDQSGRAEQLGVKVHVVRAGEFKGAGVPGTEITDAHLAEAQRIVDGVNEQFLAAVARGRKLAIAHVRKIADGRAHLAADALRMKLVDGVQTFDATFEQLAATGTQRQISAPGGAVTVEVPVSSRHSQAQLAAMASAARAATLEAARAQAPPPAAPPIPARPPAAQQHGDPSMSAEREFNEAVEAKVRAGMPRQKAVSAVVKEKPELHRRYLEAANASRPRALGR